MRRGPGLGPGGNDACATTVAERMMRDAKVLQIYEGSNEIPELVMPGR